MAGGALRCLVVDDGEVRKVAPNRAFPKAD